MDHGDMGHGGMDHGGMDHGHHGGVVDDVCSMDMLFTWKTQNLCVVFQWWHVRTQFDFVLTFLAVVLLGVGYEYVKNLASKFNDATCPNRQSLLDNSHVNVLNANNYRLKKAILYGIQVFYSFFMMLVFMTYNGWMMIAVALGAFIGYYIWGYDQSSKRDMTCH